MRVLHLFDNYLISFSTDLFKPNLVTLSLRHSRLHLTHQRN
uniref:Uncharacterized protein n=1 Tax=Anguilla anguilla TaxID=7936 RepID=A0A0E9TMY5_ANGAN